MLKYVLDHLILVITCFRFILLIIIFVSNVVLMNAIDYLGIIESVLFLVYIRPLQFSMIMFILSNDLLISFINRDLLGITSYLLINY